MTSFDFIKSIIGVTNCCAIFLGFRGRDALTNGYDGRGS